MGEGFNTLQSFYFIIQNKNVPNKYIPFQIDPSKKKKEARLHPMLHYHFKSYSLTTLIILIKAVQYAANRLWSTWAQSCFLSSKW